MNAFKPSEYPPDQGEGDMSNGLGGDIDMILFLIFGVDLLVTNPKKLLNTVANPACDLLNSETRTMRKSARAVAPPAPPRCWRSSICLRTIVLPTRTNKQYIYKRII